MLSEIGPARLVSHRFSLSDAAAAFDLIDQRPDEAVQVLLTYDP
jgi:threonine dehydrogenase-like Zn-dependent dehydrogenase